MRQIIRFFTFLLVVGFSRESVAQTKDQVFRDGLVMYNEGNFQGAIKTFKQVIEMDPNYQMAYYNLGVTYGAILQWANAVTYYSKAIKIDPKYSDAYFNRAMAYVRLVKYDKAEADLTKVIGINPKYTNAFINLGIIYFRQKKFKEAISISLQGVEVDDQNAGLMNNIGNYYLETGDDKHAMEFFNSCLKINNSSFDAVLGLAIISYNRRDWVNAKKYLQQSERLEPRLQKGMDGIIDLERSGFSYSDKKKEILKRMFAEMK